jgi:hypothetical protein
LGAIVEMLVNVSTVVYSTIDLRLSDYLAGLWPKVDRRQ